jgi:hypothetical protein
MKITPPVISKLVHISVEKFAHNRDGRAKILRQSNGRFYAKTRISDGDDTKFSPMNLLNKALYGRMADLVMDNPEVDITSDLVQFKWFAEGLKLYMTRLLEKIQFARTLQLCIFDALTFGCGVIKDGIASTEQFIEGEDEDVAVGMPYAQRIDPDDLILDPLARDWDEQVAIGHKMRVPVQLLLDSGYVKSRAEAEALPDSYAGTLRQTLHTAEGISGDRQGNRWSQEVEKYVDLVEIYLPREKLVVCLPYQRNTVETKFLHVADYEGPPRGPYHKLGFMPVPNNVLDVAPATIWYDSHMLANRIGRKISRQAERAKKVLAYTDVASEDANEIAMADDGQTVRVQNLEEIKEIELGGTSDQAYTWAAWIKEDFAEQSGESSSPTSKEPTASEYTGQQAAKATVIGNMQNKVYGFAGEVCENLAYYGYMDPLIQLPSVKEKTVFNDRGVPMRISEQVIFDPDEDRGEWFHYHIKIVPFSMTRSDPQTDVQNLMQFMTNVIPAITQASQQTGGAVQIPQTLEIIGRKLNLKEMDEIFNQDIFNEHQAFLRMQNTGDPSLNAMTIPTPPTPESMGLPGPGNPAISGGGSPQQPAPGMMQRKQGKTGKTTMRSNAQPSQRAIAAQPVKSLAQNLQTTGNIGG